MAFTPDFACGFEIGKRPMTDNNINETVAVTNTQAKTGTYSLYVRDGWGRLPYTSGCVDIACWVKPAGASNPALIELVMDNANQFGVGYDSDGVWKAYLNDVVIATGTVGTTINTWQHIQARLYVHDSAGYVQTKVNGIDDIFYVGDTTPGSSTVEYMRLRQNLVVSSFFDNFVYGSGGWPGDIRIDAIFPDSDDTAEWTPSTGADNYALVDETPPSDSDYVTGGCTPAVTDKYTLGDWNGTAKTPQFVVAWARGSKDGAGTIKLDLGVDSGGNEDMSGAEDLNIDWEYRDHIVLLDPDGSVAWDEAAIDALKLVIRTA